MAEEKPKKPAKKTAARKLSAKKSAVKKTTARKPVANKTTARKPAAKKPAAKKITPKPTEKPATSTAPPKNTYEEWTPPPHPVDPAHPMELLRDILFCLTFFTRLPIPLNDDAANRDLARASWAFPVAGVVIGGIAGFALMAASSMHLHPLFCAFAAIAVSSWVTGALHEDGLADFADGIGGGKDKESALSIMRDSRIGSYGVLSLIFFTGLKVTALSSLMGPGLAAGTIIAAATFSRGLMPTIMMLMDPARDDGLGAAAGKPDLSRFAGAAGIGILVILITLDPTVAALCLITAPIAAAVVCIIAFRKIDGQTGDVLGAAQQTAELAIYVTAAAMAT